MVKEFFKNIKDAKDYESLEDDAEFQEHMKSLRKGYPDLSYEEQCHGEEFRENADKIAELLAKKTIEGIDQKNNITVLMPWRAGLIFGMQYRNEGIENFGQISSKRDEKTLETMVDYEKYPELNSETKLIITDPMLATGNTIVDSIDRVLEKGVKAENITINAIVASSEGIKKIKETHPEVKIIVGVMDEKLDEKGYIVPGLGDFGDKYFDGLDEEAYVKTLVENKIIDEEAGEKLLARMKKQKV
jgi:uracil phosphoribosyltransferase